jgi:hypothetical protein
MMTAHPSADKVTAVPAILSRKRRLVRRPRPTPAGVAGRDPAFRGIGLLADVTIVHIAHCLIMVPGEHVAEDAQMLPGAPSGRLVGLTAQRGTRRRS